MEPTRISSSEGKVTLQAAVAIFGAIVLHPVLLYCSWWSTEGSRHVNKPWEFVVERDITVIADWLLGFDFVWFIVLQM